MNEQKNRFQESKENSQKLSNKPIDANLVQPSFNMPMQQPSHQEQNNFLGLVLRDLLFKEALRQTQNQPQQLSVSNYQA